MKHHTTTPLTLTTLTLTTLLATLTLTTQPAKADWNHLTQPEKTQIINKKLWKKTTKTNLKTATIKGPRYATTIIVKGKVGWHTWELSSKNNKTRIGILTPDGANNNYLKRQATKNGAPTIKYKYGKYVIGKDSTHKKQANGIITKDTRTKQRAVVTCKKNKLKKSIKCTKKLLLKTQNKLAKTAPTNYWTNLDTNNATILAANQINNLITTTALQNNTPYTPDMTGAITGNNTTERNQTLQNLLTKLNLPITTNLTTYPTGQQTHPCITLTNTKNNTTTRLIYRTGDVGSNPAEYTQNPCPTQP